VLPCDFYSHLSDEERDQIAILPAAGRSMGAIARALGRAKTTISRELQPELSSLGRVFAASRRRSLPIAQAA
jgi:IS30 family transposase